MNTSRISIYSSASIIGSFLVYTTTLCVFKKIKEIILTHLQRQGHIMNTACILCPEESVTVNSRKAFGLARKRNRSGSPLYSVRGGSASVPNDAVQGGRSPWIYGFSLHLHQAYAYLMNSKEKFPHLLHKSSITDISCISIYSSIFVMELFFAPVSILCVFYICIVMYLH